ncbi:MAG: nicotinamide-nucleotide amidohydrolase family protein, partial [Bacteroidales bacterium]|nr:nicotinamide-nucleotide amidohydrolase family protein [Bacteroidales bacterium]
MKDAEERLAFLLRDRHMTISTAESCTGGNIAHRLTLRSGSSAYFKGSVVSYCNEVKMKVLGVKKTTIDAFTVVSVEVAKEMAVGVRALMNTDL